MSFFLIVRLSAVRLIPRLSFFYQAIMCPEEFVAHGYGIAFHAETVTCLYRLEVRMQRSIFGTLSAIFPPNTLQIR
jgi:hypothetical protein